MNAGYLLRMTRAKDGALDQCCRYFFPCKEDAPETAAYAMMAKQFESLRRQGREFLESQYVQTNETDVTLIVRRISYEELCRVALSVS